MPLDLQAIERRDFPIGRRGYDTTAVDTHLRAVAAEFEALRRAAEGGQEASLASTAGTHVQSIIEAAEKTAAEMEHGAREAVRALRESAAQEAEKTRAEALEKARVHVAAVAQASATLLERVSAMDAELGTLLSTLRAGAGRLAADLASVEAGMGELYGAAGGTVEQQAAMNGAAAPEAPVQPAGPPPVAAQPEEAAESPEPPPSAAEPPAEEGTDLDGARLIALNMALNGETRADTERYLAENFELPDRMKLVNEVYAAIEG